MILAIATIASELMRASRDVHQDSTSRSLVLVYYGTLSAILSAVFRNVSSFFIAEGQAISRATESYSRMGLMQALT